MRHHQKGLYTVEFALVGALFLVVLFGVIEFGRALFVWNTLTEATRRGARLAAVCPVNHASIANVTVFNAPGTPGASPILAGLNSDAVVTEYLNQAQETWNTGNTSDIRYVRVSIVGFQHTLLIPPLLPGLSAMNLNAPTFETTLPSESLGCVPDPAANGNCNQLCP